MKKFLTSLLSILLFTGLAFGESYDGSGNLKTAVKNGSGASAVNIQDGGNSITVDGSLTNISGTISLPTGASTAAKQPALGTAGSASSDVLTVQGVPSMTPLLVNGSGVTQPVSASSLPLPTGAATSAKQPALGTAGSASSDVITIQGVASMTKLLVTPDSVALPANQSVNVSQINGVTPLMGAGNTGTGSIRVTIATDQAQLTNKLLVTPDANSAVNVAQINGVTVLMGNGASGTGAQRVTLANDSTGIVQPAAGTANGATPSVTISAASTNATSLKGSAGNVYMITVSNINAAARYLKFYNKASAPTVGTDTPVQVYLIPGNTAGTGSNIPVPACGLTFTTGIAFAITTGVANSDTGAVAANDIVVNIGYK